MMIIEGPRDRAGESDAAFHAAILGDDRWPPALLAQVREQARRAGLDPTRIQR